MTGYKCPLTNLQQSSLDYVTSVDDAIGCVFGSGYLNVLGMPKLRDVLPVEDLNPSLSALANYATKTFL